MGGPRGAPRRGVIGGARPGVLPWHSRPAVCIGAHASHLQDGKAQREDDVALYFHAILMTIEADSEPVGARGGRRMWINATVITADERANDVGMLISSAAVYEKQLFTHFD